MNKKLFNKILAILTSILLLVGFVPSTTVTVMAADTNTVYVGGVALTGSSDSIVYATTNENGEVITEGATADNYNIKWDGNTLTLKGAYITKEVSTPGLSSPVEGAAIGVYNQSGDANLTITLEGTNTIKDVSAAIHVFAPSGSASLTITGDGILSASSGYNPGIRVQSNTGNGTIAITGAKVTASSSYSGNGVQIRCGDGSNASLMVNGGTLTATGSGATFAGIIMQFGSSTSGSGTPTVTVSDNAIVRANGSAGGITSNSSAEVQIATGTGESGGIVFDNENGTVYGNVTLQENLTINQGESLTIGDGASLNTGNNKVIVNGGTLNGEDKITGTVKYAPSITTASLPEGKVNEEYDASLTATGSDPITWNVTDGNLPTGLNLSTNGKIIGIPTAPGDYVFTVTASNDAGSVSKELTIHMKDVDPIYSIQNSGDINFADALEGYKPEVKTITITNDGNQPITLEQPVSSESFEVGTLLKTELNAGQTAEFTVQPKTGLSAGSYNENIVITGINNGKSISTTVNVKFNVKHVHSYGEPTWEWANDNTAKAIFKCEKGDDTQNLSGIMSSKITKDATCDAKGIRTYTAKVTFGGKEYTATKDIEIPTLSCNTSQGNDQPYDDGGPFTRNECGDVFDRWGNLIYDAPDCVVKPKPTTSPQTTSKPENTTETTLEPVKTEEPEQSPEPEKTTTPKPTIEASSTPDSDVKVEKENSFGFIWWILGGIGVAIVGIVAYLVIKNNTEDDE